MLGEDGRGRARGGRVRSLIVHRLHRSTQIGTSRGGCPNLARCSGRILTAEGGFSTMEAPGRPATSRAVNQKTAQRADGDS